MSSICGRATKRNDPVNAGADQGSTALGTIMRRVASCRRWWPRTM